MFTSAQQRSLPVLAALAAIISVQTGAALAKSLFAVIGPEGVAALRLGISALLLGTAFRPWRLWRKKAALGPLLAYGLMLGLMNLLIYRAFAFVPVGIAVSIEVAGPLAVALLASRQRIDLLWIGLSLGGMLLLSRDAWRGALDPRGLAFALGAALCWGLYIVFGKRVAQGGGQSVASGMLIAAGLALPLGLAHAGAQLLAPRVLALGVTVALLSSAIPFLLDMFAMRHLPAPLFGILLSASPAVSALAGWLVLGETLSASQCLGIAEIMSACAGSAILRQRSAVALPRIGAAGHASRE